MSLKILIIITFTFFFIFSANAQSFSKKFDFGNGRATNGYISVSNSDVYSKEKGFGFEDASNIKCLDRDHKNPLLSGFCTSEKPFYFSAAVPEGNYRVTVTFGDKTIETANTVKAELRRLLVENIETKKGKFRTKTFIVNIRNPEISTGGIVKLKDREKLLEAWAWDEKLTLEFNGSNPSVNAIEIEKIDTHPTVFLMGDSTVCDQPGEPYASWGQMLTAFFTDKIAVANHAESGESLRSSFGAKRLDKVLSLLKKGDYVLIQFAHNDEKDKSEGAGAMTTFKASLLQWIDAVKAKGGNPVLITPMHRRTFDKDGKITNSHGEYPEAVRIAANEKGVPLIDLTAMSKELYEALGKDGSSILFKDGDGTHHNNYGAYQLAKLVGSALKMQKLPLSKYLKKDFKLLNPKKPDAPENVKIPASPNFQNTKPLGS